MIQRLEKLTSEFAKKLLFSVKCRIIDRRLPVISTLQAYLENPNFLDTLKDEKLQYADREEMAEAAARLITRLFPPAVECENEEDPDEPEEIGYGFWKGVTELHL